MAGRIPPSFIDELLTRIDIIDVIDGYVPLKRAGKNHQALCPFHDEKTPSFTVSQDKQFYHCFGCGANGTAISFLMDYGGMDFIAAIEELASRAGLEVPREGGTVTDKKSSTELYELMEMVVRFYCKQLREHNKANMAVDYLKQRGISGEIAAEFEIGFAPPGWDALLHNLGGSQAAEHRLLKIGVILKKDNGGYYDRFRERIIFPIRDQRGRAIGVGGRILGDGTPKYLNSPETAIFHKGRELYGLFQARRKLRDFENIYIVEGYMDVLALAQHGIYNAVATLGTAVTQEHLDRLFRICPQLIFCFDGDLAGQKAAWRALEMSLPMLRDGRQTSFMFMPENDDPDSFIRKHGREKFEDTSNYLPLSDYLLNSQKQDINLDTREGRALLVDKMNPYLAKLPDGPLSELIINDLAKISGLQPDKIRGLIPVDQPVIKTPGHKINRVKAQENTHSPVSKAIKLILNQPSLALLDGIQEKLTNVDIRGIEFLLELVEFIRINPGIRCAGILEHWRDSRYADRLNELAVMEVLLSETSDIEKDFLDTLSKIRELSDKHRRMSLAKNVQNLEDLRKLRSAGSVNPED